MSGEYSVIPAILYRHALSNASPWGATRMLSITQARIGHMRVMVVKSRHLTKSNVGSGDVFRSSFVPLGGNPAKLSALALLEPSQLVQIGRCMPSGWPQIDIGSGCGSPCAAGNKGRQHSTLRDAQAKVLCDSSSTLDPSGKTCDLMSRDSRRTLCHRRLGGAPALMPPRVLQCVPPSAACFPAT